MTSGLLPTLQLFAPHAGTFAVVFVQHIAAYPARAAMRPYVPPRIQWFVLRIATQPMPCCAASSMARVMPKAAFVQPTPRFPFQRSSAPKAASSLGSAFGSTEPLSM